VKYVCKVVIVIPSVRDIVMGRQDREGRAVSSVYKARWVCELSRLFYGKCT
jgi:hypothetical protein